MKPTVVAAAVGSTALFAFQSADAAVLQWTDPDTRQLQVAWSSEEAEVLAKRLRLDDVKVSSDEKAPLKRLDLEGVEGPVLLLTKPTARAIAVDPGTGTIYGLQFGPKGELLGHKVLADAYASLPALVRAERGASASRGRGAAKRPPVPEVLISVTATVRATPAGLLDPSKDVSTQGFDVEIQAYTTEGDASQVVDSARLGFAGEELAPVVSARALSNVERADRVATVNYWTTGTDFPTKAQ